MIHSATTSTYLHIVNLPAFIARRTIFPKGKSFAGFIMRLAIIAYALSIAVMIIASALIRGFKKEISQKMFGCWGHIHIVKTTSNRNFEQDPIKLDDAFYPSLEETESVRYAEVIEDDLEADPIWRETKGGIRKIQVFTNLPGIIVRGDQFEGMILKGVDRDYDWEYFERQLVHGSTLELPRDSLTDQLMISKTTSDRMQIDTGDAVVVHFIRNRKEVRKRFRVCGVYSTGLSDFDSKFALIDMRKAREILQWEDNWIGGYEVFVDHLEDVEPINDYIYGDVIPHDLYSESIKTKFPNIFDWLELQDINEWVIMGLMLIVAMINLVIMLLIIILERTQMIGVMKSLGARDTSLRRVFLYKAAIIMVIGTLLGNVIGIGLCKIQQWTKWISLNEENYFLDYAPIYLDPWIILLINVGAMILCLLILIIPSTLISRLTPSKVLRFR